VIAASTFSLFKANIHPTPVSQPWQQAPREHPGKSSAGPVFTAAGGQVAATRKGQGRPNQAKPTTTTNGGHYFWRHFPQKQAPLTSQKILKQDAASELRAVSHPTPAVPGKAGTPRDPEKPTRHEACPVIWQDFRTSGSAPRFAGERLRRSRPQNGLVLADF